MIAGRSAKRALAEQPAPLLAEEGRFGEWLSRHASLPASHKIAPNEKAKLLL